MRLSKWFSCACAALVAAAGATTCPAQTYVSTSGPTLIPDNLSATANLTTGANMANVSVVVPDTFNAASVAVTVGITHTFDGDVAQLVLVSPAGTVYTLKNATGIGSSSDNFKNTTFDNTSTVTFGGTGGTTPPFRSRFKGTSAISGTSTFASAQGAGIPVNGTWTVRAADSANGDTGTIDYVVLSFNEQVRVGQDGTTTNQSGSGSASPSQTGLNLSIPDNSATGVSSTLSVAAADSVIIGGIDLSFSVTHPSLSDLRVRLIHPNGTTSVDVVVPGTLTGSATTTVTDGGTPNTPNRPYATLVADGAASFATGAAPYRGKFAPANALSAFNGLASSGTWTLKVFDEVASSTGSVREWTLHVREASGACCRADNTCTEGPSTTCNLVGVFQGTGTSCGTVTCPASVGRCCTSINCLVTSSAACAGSYTAGGTCTTNVCGFPCCDLNTGACSVVASTVTCGGVSGAAGAACATITCAAPANDLCANAQVIPGSGPFPISVLGQNATAVDTANFTPAVCASSSRDVWYSFTPTAAAAYSFTLCNTVSGTLDTVLSVHSACPVSGANNLDPSFGTNNCNDDGCSGSAGPSALGGLSLVPGTTYLIRVAMFNTKTGGPFRIDITTEPFGACCDSTSTCTLKTQSQCVATSGNIFIGGGTLCSTSGICNGACCVASSGSCTFTDAASCTGTHGGIGSTCTQTFCPTTTCCNDATGACTLTGTAGCAAGSTPNAASTCAAANCPISACCNPANGACTITGSVACPGGTNPLAATSCSTPSNPCPQPPPPSNDLACGALPLTVNVSAFGDNTFATNTNDGPAPSCQEGNGKGVWYSFSPPASGAYAISTCGSNQDTVLSVLTDPGSNCNLTSNFVQVSGGCDDDSCDGTTPPGSGAASLISSITLSSGTLYYIRVSSYSSTSSPAGGAYTLVVNSIASGACCNASTGACTITAAAGCGSSNFYQGDNFSCPGASCAAVASCCNNSTGACTLIYGGSCASGTTPGTGATCGAGACPGTGACCLPAAGTCSVVLSTSCSGTYFGDATSCAAQTCPNQSCNGDCASGATCSSINGGFESGDLAGWTKIGTTPLLSVFSGPYTNADPDQTPHSGTYALAAGPTGNPPSNGVSQVINAAAGAQVTVKFWYLCNPGTTPNNEFVASFDGATLVDLVDDNANTTWTQFTFTATVSSANPTLSFLFFNSPDYTFLDDVSVCVAAATPPGVCCRGATCTTAITSSAACAAATTTTSTGGPGWRFVNTASPCNAGVNADGTYSGGLTSTTSPCCFANYNHNTTLEVQDIFDFLNDWFAGRPIAIPGGDGTSHTGLAVQNIFNFLNAWFAGGCN